MPFCPRCQTEFAAHVTRCADCDVPLVDHLPAAQSDTGDDKNEELVYLFTYPTMMHAEMVVEALANAGIPAMIKSNEMFGAGTGMGTITLPQVDVWVPKHHAEAAREIAEQLIDPV